jgi:sugar-phosphatase
VTTARRPGALLLDLDGTLVDSEPLHRRGYEAYFAHQGWDVPDLTIFTGRRAEDVFATEPGPWAGLDPMAVLEGVLRHVPDEAAAALPGARELIEAARDVVDGKPHPAGFALACERLGADPARAVAAEDSPAGVRAAIGAGVRHVHGIATTHARSVLVDAGAVEVHDDLRPLLALLEG